MHRLGLLTVSLVLTLAVIGMGVVAGNPPRAELADRRATSAPADPHAVLRGWDRRRAVAWSRGDPAALRRLYVAGSATGRRDVRMLQEYADRGLRVRRLCTQLLSVRTVDRSAGRLLLVVTDRLCGGVVVGDGISQRLPGDVADRRLVSLVRRDGDWLVDQVRRRVRPRSLRGRHRPGTCNRRPSTRPAHLAPSRAPPEPSRPPRT